MKTTGTAAPTNGMAPAANGASRSSACAGTSSTPWPGPRSRPACRPATTSTAATTKAWATSRSTRSAAGAGTRPRPSCARLHAARQLQAVDRRAGHAAAARSAMRDGVPALPRHRGAAGRPAAAARTARREVILGAGAIGSPQILQLSGIGAGAHAGRSTASTPQHELPGVGANLQDHLQIRAVFKVRGREDAEHASPTRLGQGRHRPGVPADAQRADEHGAVAAGRLHAQRPGAALRRTSSTTCSRCQPGRLRRAAARLRRLHRQRVQPQPDQPRLGAHPQPATPRTRRASRPTTCPRPKTARWPPIRCA